jgi:hypothetical protein
MGMENTKNEKEKSEKRKESTVSEQLVQQRQNARDLTNHAVLYSNATPSPLTTEKHLKLDALATNSKQINSLFIVSLGFGRGYGRG